MLLACLVELNWRHRDFSNKIINKVARNPTLSGFDASTVWWKLNVQGIIIETCPVANLVDWSSSRFGAIEYTMYVIQGLPVHIMEPHSPWFYVLLGDDVFCHAREIGNDNLFIFCMDGGNFFGVQFQCTFFIIPVNVGGDRELTVSRDTPLCITFWVIHYDSSRVLGPFCWAIFKAAPSIPRRLH